MRSVIISYARTPFGKFGGSLLPFSAVELGGFAVREAVKRSGVPADKFSLAILGHVITAGCGQIPARQAVHKAGIPEKVPVDSINKVCASSMRAVSIADSLIRGGDADVVIAGGMESMSNAPYASNNMRWGHKMFDTKFSDLMVKDGLWCPSYDRHMAVHGGIVAKQYGITREMQDLWAFNSQRKAKEAIQSGKLEKELVSVDLPDGSVFLVDESPRFDTTLEKLSKLKPIFSPDNTVTAGNAPGCNDGASAMVVAREDTAVKNNWNIEAAIVGQAMYSEDSQNIATAPGNAILGLLKKTGINMGEVGLIEINEAFAAVALVSGKIAGCNMDIVNVNGGAIAYGHPLGASGARILMTLISELQRRNLKYGIAAICSGMGQGDAMLIENCCYH